MVFARVVLVIQGCTHLVATYCVPELGAIVDVDGVGVVFPAAYGHHLFTGRKEKVVGEVPVEVSPVGALEKGVGKANVGRIDTLTQVVTELTADGAVQCHDQVFSCKTVVPRGRNGVVLRVIVDGKVGAGVKLKVV